MKRIALALATILPSTGVVFAAVDLPSEASGQHEEHCRDEWTKRDLLDQRMYRYCLGQEHEGYQQLTSLVAKHDQPWMAGVVGDAIEKWSKRGVRDDRMVAYTVHQEVEAFLDYDYARKKPGFNEAAFAQCRGEYMTEQKPDWSLAMYCYKQIIDK